MEITIDDIRNKLIEKGLKITPQRMSILEAVHTLNHPSAENIIEFIRQKHPNIATGTVYKVLETLIDNRLIKKVTTDKDIKRYDAILESHHHIHFIDSDKIEDYFDTELTDLLKSYFEEKSIPDFKIEDINLQIFGKKKK